MRRRLVHLGAGAALLLAACSGSGEEAGRPSFSQKLEADSEKFTRAKQQERQQQEQRRKEMEEAYRRRWQSAGGATLPDTASPGARPAPASGDDVQYVLSDKDLTFLVLNKLRLMQGASAISVSCQEGRVQLFGEVESAAKKEELVRALKALPGVLKIDAGEFYVKTEQ